MVKFSFVIPTFNRKENLRLALVALLSQSDHDFEIIISDDGSTDGTREMVLELAHTNPWFDHELRVKYYWQQDKGYRVSLARNQGTRLADKATTHVWFIDSDVLLVHEAVTEARKLCSLHPEAIICGRYDWLPPMQFSPEDVRFHMDFIIAASFPRLEVDYPHEKEVRPDHRPVAWDCETLHSGYGTLSGNLIVPKTWLIRGFDEAIEGQGQDGEFGHHIRELGAKMIFCDKMRGYHLAHHIDLAWKERSVQKTIAYIRERYYS